MAGTTIRLLPRTDYDFTGLASNSSATITIARKIDTSRWREAVILVRLHAATWSGNMQFQINSAPDGYTDEDPGLIWNSGFSGLLIFTQSGDTPPSEKNFTIPTPFGPLMKIMMTVITPVGVSGPFKTSISIDLNLKGE